MYQPDNPRSLEKYSSAVSLSDMEIFIFPELIYSLTLANCMSPLVWSWRNDPWFRGREKMNSYRLLQRVKQYIMDNFTFNLDLDTWGLTTKKKELRRFSAFIDEQTLSRSNALFGYEGDKYYFDIDIRRHFGLDRYITEVIPYWKTETVEAMHAFRHKPAYTTGAGECVSLSTLYASAMHVVGGISLDDIYLLATPLHSQNFIDIRDGVITNNRRIVTKTMWFNGTEISAKARRAILNERITVVAHRSGYVHTLYPEATMDPTRYEHFAQRFRSYLASDIDYTLLTSFLRDRSSLQKCFQFAHTCCGKPRYIQAEKVFAYEHGSKARVGDETHEALIHEIDEDDFYPAPIANRIILDELETFFKERKISVDNPCNMNALKSQLKHTCFNVEDIVRDLMSFAKTEPRLPDTGKQWVAGPAIDLDGAVSADEVRERLESLRATNETADLAFAALRDMRRTAWRPFMKAALERNPVSIVGALPMTVAQAAEKLAQMPGESIYDGSRVAQPDEVWNYGRGDGLEKAICLLAIARSRPDSEDTHVDGDEQTAVVRTRDAEFRFATGKRLAPPPREDCLFSFDNEGIPAAPPPDTDRPAQSFE